MRELKNENAVREAAIASNTAQLPAPPARANPVFHETLPE